MKIEGKTSTAYNLNMNMNNSLSPNYTNILINITQKILRIQTTSYPHSYPKRVKLTFDKTEIYKAPFPTKENDEHRTDSVCSNVIQLSEIHNNKRQYFTKTTHNLQSIISHILFSLIFFKLIFVECMHMKLQEYTDIQHTHTHAFHR